jgi:hypothetical protein
MIGGRFADLVKYTEAFEYVFWQRRKEYNVIILMGVKLRIFVYVFSLWSYVCVIINFCT